MHALCHRSPNDHDCSQRLGFVEARESFFSSGARHRLAYPARRIKVYGLFRSLRASTVARSHNITSRFGYVATLCLYFDRASLSRTVDDIPQGVFVAFSEHPDIADGLLDVERWSEMLREVGFGSSPKTAEEFVQSFIADRKARRG